MLRQNSLKVILCRQAPYIFELFFMTVMRLSHGFLRIVKRSSVNRLQLGFVNVFIVNTMFRCLTDLNIIYLRRSVHDIVVIKWCSKWWANEYYFYPFLIIRSRSEKWPTIFLECLICVIYRYSGNHWSFYFVD